MPIFKNITQAAIDQINYLANFQNIPLDKLYVQINDKEAGPWKMFWIITLTDTFDSAKYYLEELGGLRLAVEKPSSIFLVGAIIDYDPNDVNKPFYNEIASPIDPDRPVLPKGFSFKDQNIFPRT